MRKTERLNDMMIYLNNKNYFNLKDIMDRYQISKSTALRDIDSLEQIGMPLFSEFGRNGRYGILKNRILSPIIFSMDEMYALYFSMITLGAYESTPFHISLKYLKRKFEACLSSEHINAVHKMENILSFEAPKHHNSSPYLQIILNMAIEEIVCEILYDKRGNLKTFTVQFINISARFGQWYVTAYNFDANQVQVFRCDKITSLDECNTHNPIPINELLSPTNNTFRHKNSTDFEVVIQSQSVDLFYKEHYPSMQLHVENDQYIIRGFYNPGEENFIANYFLTYTDNIMSIKPPHLKTLLLEKISNLDRFYKCL